MPGLDIVLITMHDACFDFGTNGHLCRVMQRVTTLVVLTNRYTAACLNVAGLVCGSFCTNGHTV